MPNNWIDLPRDSIVAYGRAVQALAESMNLTAPPPGYVQITAVDDLRLFTGCLVHVIVCWNHHLSRYYQFDPQTAPMRFGDGSYGWIAVSEVVGHGHSVGAITDRDIERGPVYVRFATLKESEKVRLSYDTKIVTA